MVHDMKFKGKLVLNSFYDAKTKVFVKSVSFKIATTECNGGSGVILRFF
jgi:hypothetical protein